MDTKTKDPVTPKRHEIYLDRRYYNIPSGIENRQSVFLNRTPEYLVQEQGWFPYYFRHELEQQSDQQYEQLVKQWLLENKLPVDLFTIETREVYPLYKYNAYMQRWEGHGFSESRLEALTPPVEKTSLLGKVKSKIEHLLSNNETEAEPKGIYLSSYVIASEYKPTHITILHNPNMARHKAEPLYIQGIIQIGKTTYTDVSREYPLELMRFDWLPLIKQYFLDYEKLPYLIAKGVNDSLVKTVSHAFDNLDDLIEAAHEIAELGYLSTPDNRLQVLPDNSPFLAIRCNGASIYLDKHGDVKPYEIEKFNRIQNILAQGEILSSTDPVFDLVISSYKLAFKPLDQLHVIDNPEWRWVQKSLQKPHKTYWVLEAHYSGKVENQAMFWHTPRSDEAPESLAAYLSGMAYVASEKSPSQSCLEHIDQSGNGIQPEEIEVFKTNVENLVKHYLYVLKKHIEQNG